jgi:phytoene dehydrogenase-like protein
VPGGAVHTEELTLPGFAHDVYSAVHPAAAASPVFERMPLDRHGLRWVHPGACYAHPLADGRGAALYRDLHRTAASLERLDAGAGEAWGQFALPYARRFEGLRRLFLGAFPPVAGAARVRPRALLELGRVSLMPAQTLAGELFGDPAARAWLYGSAMHGDVPVTAAGSAIVAVYLNLLGHGAGWPSPEGGAGRLTAALVSYLRELGGELRTGTEVVEIATRRGRVTGVRLRGGEPLAGPVVIADVLPRALVSLAAAALPAPYAAALSRYRPGPATLKLDWALAGPIPWSYDEARAAGTVHVGGDERELIDGGLVQESLPERPFVLLGQQSIADPSRAPAGRHTAWAYAHGPQPLDWNTQGDRHVERMEAQIERFAPGFRDLVIARHVLSPSDFQRRNANLIGGDVGGGSYGLDQLLFRPVPRLLPYRTPVSGLYIASAATFPGGGVHGVAGHAAARLALVQSRVTGARTPWRWPS